MTSDWKPPGHDPVADAYLALVMVGGLFLVACIVAGILGTLGWI